MLAVDGTGIPLTFLTEAANISEFKLVIQTMDTISVASRPLHPRRRPDCIIADKGYDAGWLRRDMRKRGIIPYIPKRREQGETEEPAYNATIKDQYADGLWNEPVPGSKTTGELRFGGIAIRSPTKFVSDGFRDDF